MLHLVGPSVAQSWDSCFANTDSVLGHVSACCGIANSDKASSVKAGFVRLFWLHQS